MFIAMRWWDVLEGWNPKKNSAESDSSHRGDHPRRLYELHVFGCYGVPSKNDD